MDTQFDRPSHWLQWAQETFGDVALDPSERTLRFVEEAVELAQAMELPAEAVSAITARVYARPAGQVRQELGQCLATLELLARVVEIDADAEATLELVRVKAIPRQEWRRRHATKIALGIAR